MENLKNIVEKGKPAHNRIVTVRRLSAARVQSARSVASLAPTPPSPTLPAPANLRFAS